MKIIIGKFDLSDALIESSAEILNESKKKKKKDKDCPLDKAAKEKPPHIGEEILNEIYNAEKADKIIQGIGFEKAYQKGPTEYYHHPAHQTGEFITVNRANGDWEHHIHSGKPITGKFGALYNHLSKLRYIKGHSSIEEDYNFNKPSCPKCGYSRVVAGNQNTTYSCGQCGHEAPKNTFTKPATKTNPGQATLIAPMTEENKERDTDRHHIKSRDKKRIKVKLPNGKIVWRNVSAHSKTIGE